LRVGDWRVVYELAGRTVSVLEVAKREEIYRRGGF
jgi:mRNA-degrading endonuclease RelE of RelBE toxin-antitoxin system